MGIGLFDDLGESDLLIAILGVAIAGGFAFAAGRRVGRKWGRRTAAGVTAACLLAAIATAFLFRDAVGWAAVLPFSGLIVLSRPAPICLAAMAGVMSADGRMPVVRSGVLIGAVSVAGAYYLVEPVLGRPPACRDRRDDGVCIQTTPVTCTAACAATLLREVGIEADEAEMARLCLTRGEGTLWMGLYRGLKLRTARTPWDVAVASGTAEDLIAGGGPAVVAVGIEAGTDAAPIYAEQYGWTPGVPHSAIFFAPAGDDRVAMGEPTEGVGREEWSREDLDVLYRGRALRLIRRKNP